MWSASLSCSFYAHWIKLNIRPWYECQESNVNWSDSCPLSDPKPLSVYSIVPNLRLLRNERKITRGGNSFTSERSGGDENLQSIRWKSWMALGAPCSEYANRLPICLSTSGSTFPSSKPCPLPKLLGQIDNTRLISTYTLAPQDMLLSSNEIMHALANEIMHVLAVQSCPYWQEWNWKKYLFDLWNWEQHLGKARKAKNE